MPSHWIITYLSTEDVDAKVAAFVEAGGQEIVPAMDMQGVGRMARVTDPQGTHVMLFRSAQGDPPDRDFEVGDWCWNELWAVRLQTLGHTLVLRGEHSATSAKAWIWVLSGTYYMLNDSTGGYPGVESHDSHERGTRPPTGCPTCKLQTADKTAEQSNRSGRTIDSTATADIPNIGTVCHVLALIRREQSSRCLPRLEPSRVLTLVHSIPIEQKPRSLLERPGFFCGLARSRS